MGASNSLINSSKNIYISYPKKNKDNLYINSLQQKLSEKKFYVINSDNSRELLYHLDADKISESVGNILERTIYFVICISGETISSFHQTIEINNCFEYNKEIIYLIIDKSYTPENNQFVNSLVKNKKWLRFYNDEQFDDCLDYLSSLNL
jgi:hypothetical protein